MEIKKERRERQMEEIVSFNGKDYYWYEAANLMIMFFREKCRDENVDHSKLFEDFLSYNPDFEFILNFMFC